MRYQFIIYEIWYSIHSEKKKKNWFFGWLDWTAAPSMHFSLNLHEKKGPSVGHPIFYELFWFFTRQSLNQFELMLKDFKETFLGLLSQYLWSLWCYKNLKFSLLL